MLTVLQTSPTALQVVWFLLVAVLWIGYFFLEGFDYGVAMLIPVLGKDDEKARRVIINTIGPIWDGNEVWLITAGGATFAAFPGWYATLFSALYLPLFLVLVGLILRGVAFEYRAKRDDLKWKRAFDFAASFGSLLPALVLGIGFANFVRGVRTGPDLLMAQSFWSLFNPFALLGGLLFVSLFLTHGAVFLALKTRGEIHDKARLFAMRSAAVTLVLMVAFVVAQNVAHPLNDAAWLNAPALTWVTGVLAVVGVAAAWWLTRVERDGWAFAATGLAVLMLTAGILLKMYGNLGFTPVDPAHPLDMVTASSSPMTLKLMTIFAVIFLPIVLAYEAWSYWVFRKRLTTASIPEGAH
ncbi:MAG TPA: cytochrome d ubiquinol oxidase subunit II [Propionibacteriaceae bacterium]|nr:cytochrome d ubiquinol oxidase subunit II [Propionibacteriaceae bacterium]